MKRMRTQAAARTWLVAVVAAGLGLSACSPQDTEVPVDLGGDQAGVIIGTNDEVAVAAGGSNIPARYRPLLNAFGRAIYNGGACTATHIGNGIVISAGHCFGAGSTRENDTPCSGGYVDFGYIAGASGTRSNCTTVLAKATSSGNVDYAIYRVSPIPATSVPVDLSAFPATGTPLTIFGHPGARPLTWSQTCTLQNPSATQFGYQCDTEGGSSGSAVLRDDTLQAVGIHWGGGGDQNAATALVATPLGEYLSGGIDPSALYEVRNVNSGKCVDASWAGTADGTVVLQYQCTGGANQQWRFQPTDSGYYNVVPTYASWLTWDVNGGPGATGDAAMIQLWGFSSPGGTNQQWRPESLGNGVYRFVARHSGRCLDVPYSSTDDNVQLWQWGCNNTNAQAFVLTRR